MAARARERLSSAAAAHSSKDKLTTTTTTTTTTSASILLPTPKLAVYFSLFVSLWFLILFVYFSSSHSSSTTTSSAAPLLRPSTADLICVADIAPFFIYDLPDHFNAALLRRCNSLNIYADMCPHVANRGLGRPVPSLTPTTTSASSSSWYATHQFVGEMIFHARAERHPCRTLDPAAAELFYVPFYAGLYGSSQFSQSNHSLRDTLALDLATHLSDQPFFLRRGGRDHFLAIGRTTWDFMRNDTNPDFGANRLLLLPELANMSVLTVERHPWQGRARHQFGIPYPSYFHPTSAAEVAAWQDTARRSKRTHLFAFVGGPRPPTLEMAAVRAKILRQCGSSSRCLQAQCAPGSKDCHEPDRVLRVMLAAEFCMQPPGDSFTRRSTFDSILAGCVPVFFSEHTAYTQYHWHAPARPEEWSVLLTPDRWGRMEEELARIPRQEVEGMREAVIRMIPRVTYAHPNASRSELLGFRDAVDVALAELSRLVRSGSREMNR